jgi:hypothetical protein
MGAASKKVEHACSFDNRSDIQDEAKHRDSAQIVNCVQCWARQHSDLCCHRLKISLLFLELNDSLRYRQLTNLPHSAMATGKPEPWKQSISSLLRIVMQHNTVITPFHVCSEYKSVQNTDLKAILTLRNAASARWKDQAWRKANVNEADR